MKIISYFVFFLLFPFCAQAADNSPELHAVKGSNPDSISRDYFQKHNPINPSSIEVNRVCSDRLKSFIEQTLRAQTESNFAVETAAEADTKQAPTDYDRIITNFVPAIIKAFAPVLSKPTIHSAPNPGCLDRLFCRTRILQEHWLAKKTEEYEKEIEARQHNIDRLGRDLQPACLQLYHFVEGVFENNPGARVQGKLTLEESKAFIDLTVSGRPESFREVIEFEPVK